MVNWRQIELRTTHFILHVYISIALVISRLPHSALFELIVTLDFNGEAHFASRI